MFVISFILSVPYSNIVSAVEVTILEHDALKSFCQKTKVLINIIGLYHLYSSPVVEACALTGTHYVNTTGEALWESEMISKFHAKAQEKKTIMIPVVGIESAISDMLTWSMANLIRENYNVGLGEVTVSFHDLGARPSGGSLLMAMSILKTYGISGIAAVNKLFALSPIPGPKAQPTESWFMKLTGVRMVSNLGILTTSISASFNKPVVECSWGLLEGGKLYGPNFSYSEYMMVRGFAVGVLLHYGFTLRAMALIFPPIRWLAKRFVTAPGSGPSKEAAAKEYLEYRAMVVADWSEPNPPRAIGRFRFDGGMYYLTAILLVEAAMVILEDPTLSDRLGGGLLTPATLGQPFVERMRRSGIVLETEIL